MAQSIAPVLEPQRVAARSVPGRVFILYLCVALLHTISCPAPAVPMAAAPGLPEYQEIAALPLPGGARVNVMGGNLLLSRTDLTLDTQLGPFSVGATWNSAAREWRWSFDGVKVVSGNFTDDTGATHALGSIANGAAVPGTQWVRTNLNACGALQVKTKGGLQQEFRCDGRPLYLRWTSSYEPYVQFSQNFAADGQLHTTAITQCLAAGGGCHPLFTMSYDAQGHVTQITDRANRSATFSYDASGRLIQARDALDIAKGWSGTIYAYNTPSGSLASVTNSEGERVEYGYDDSNLRLASVRQVGLGNPTQSFYYEAKNAAHLYVTRAVDPLGHETRFRYDGDRQLREVESMATGDELTRTWANKRVASLTRPDGVTTSFTYANDDVATLTDPSGNVTTFTYQSNGVDHAAPRQRPLLEVSDALGVLHRRGYDASGRLVWFENGAAERISMVYGADEMLSTVTTPDGVVTTLSSYGSHGHAALVSRSGKDRYFVYDEVGNVTDGSDPLSDSDPQLGGVIARTFDADRNVAAVELGSVSSSGANDLIETLSIQHRSDGRRTQIIRPGGGDAQFVYDAIGRLIERREMVDGTWRATAYGWDALSRQISISRPNGMRQEWSYDTTTGQMTGIKVLRNGQLQSEAFLRYDGAGRLTIYTDSSYLPSWETYTYDPAGRITRSSFASGERVDWTYDARSRPAQLALRNADGSLLRTLEFGYDAAGRSTLVKDNGTSVLQRSFAAGRIASIAYGNQLVRTYSYEAVTGFPTGMTTTRPGEPTVEQLDLDMDEEGCWGAQCILETGGASSVEWYFLGPNPESDRGAFQGKRVTQVASPTYSFWDYDTLSNRYDQLVPDIYNAERNRLLQANTEQGAISYAYDAAGFVTQRAGTPIQWDAGGRIAAIGSDTFQWDIRGRAVAKSVAGTTTRYRFGGLVEADGEGAPRAIDLREVRIDLQSGARKYRHFDFRGNVKLITDDAGQAVARYGYDAYGMTTIVGDASDPIRFAQGTQRGDLLILGHRLYDSSVGRFLAPDPFYQLINQYSYTLGNPVQFWDPSGNEAALVAAAAASGFASITANFAASLLTTAAAGAVVVDPPMALGFGTAAGGLRVAAWGFGGLAATFSIANVVYESANGALGAPGSATPAVVIGGSGGVGSVGSVGYAAGARDGGGAGGPVSPPGSGDGGDGTKNGGVNQSLDLVIAIEAVAPSPGGCAPSRLVGVPSAGWALAFLVPLNVLLGTVVWHRSRRRRTLDRRAA